jgi:general secretion pathway protein G
MHNVSPIGHCSLKSGNSRQKGFTLMELLIVMVILGILTTIVASSFRTSQEKAHDSRRKNDLESMAKALEVYYNDHNEYPASVNGNFSVSNCGSAGDNPCNFGGEFKDTNGTLYMAKMPEETTGSRRYYYYSDGQYQAFALYTRLENELDKDIPKNASDGNQYYDGTNCGTGFAGCNYAVSSTNISPESYFPLADE